MIKTQIFKEPRRYPKIIYGVLPSDLLPVWVLEATRSAAKYLSLSTIKLNEVKIGQGEGPTKSFYLLLLIYIPHLLYNISIKYIITSNFYSSYLR